MRNNKKILFEIGLFATFAIFIGSIVLNKSLGDMDELWNYNFANCMAKGLVPYKDFSMVQTPFLPIITGIVLKIFSNSLVVMRILATLLGSAIMFMIYKILDKLKVNKSVNLLSNIALLFILKDYFCIDYNFFSVFLVLLIIYLEITLDTKKIYSNILIGFIAGLTFLTKQTIGGFVCISIVIYKLILEIYKYKTTKQKIDEKSIMYRIFGGIIPAVMFSIYLLLNNAFQDFIDYAILGITTFSNQIKYSNLIESSDIIICFLSVYIPISFILIAIYSIKNKEKNLFIILILSLSSIILVFPISDNIHFLVGIIPSIIGNIYLLNKLLKKLFSNKMLPIKLFLNAFSYLILIYICVSGIANEYSNFAKEKYYSKLKHFENIPIDKDFEEKINLIDKYIEYNNQKVYILNFDAAIYMIPLDLYNKNYDMLMKGNFGINGEKGLIEDIKKLDNAEFLVLNKNFTKNWQHPYEVTDYIETNYNNIGNIVNYEIYKK
ncbi:MAG: glycosyltransferase family 39 protein [Clostridia bacterium]|nr:glycosyltransferase family 39 protein [Clostridia bacterium]